VRYGVTLVAALLAAAMLGRRRHDEAFLETEAVGVH
jgi:uncharacterized protein (TIGR03382 family)